MVEGVRWKRKQGESMRLQKYLALCGVASRRKREEYIRRGKWT
jgi:16S rRNA U516 pseudouridylate synthase RsuA-like enzyme